MAQVPPCGCSSGGSAGGGGTCASVVVSHGFCADDGSNRPLLARTVVMCNGTIDAGIYELDGDPYVGDVKQCDIQCCPEGGASSRYEAMFHSFMDLDDVTAETFSLVPGGADFVLIENPPRGSRPARWLDDGSNPSAGTLSSSHWIMPGVTIEYRGDFNALRFISDAAAGSRINFTFYQYV